MKSKKKSKKKKKKDIRKRDDSSSSSSSSDGNDSDDKSTTHLLLKLEKERLALKEKRRKDKELLKKSETPEEKRERRLKKRLLKEEKGRIIHGGDVEGNYTNESNPFGDSALSQTFRWNKKLSAEGLHGLKDKELDKRKATICKQQAIEYEKVKKARLQREKEKEEREKLLELQERSRENQQFDQWRQDEEDFHLKQARLRSQIRIKDGRAKPIDLLAKYISTEDEIDAIEMHEPYTYLNGLNRNDLQDLVVDINLYKDIDLDKNKEFWEDITVIVKDELQKLEKREFRRDSRQGVNKAVVEDVQKIFKEKNTQQLQDLQRGIEHKLNAIQDGAQGLDIGYWESLLSQLKAHLARARLKDKHSENLKIKLKLLKAEQKLQNEDEDNQCPSGSSSPKIKNEAIENVSELEDYKKGGYSPIYLTNDDIDRGTLVITESEDYNTRSFNQERVMRGGRTIETAMNGEEKAMEREAKKGMTEEESTFSVESLLEQKYEWSDKYRPRKPRYFNRVHTGFEWNKYNQTHYDIDNPPPKIVQGYKFNIFYPDLIDKDSTPNYTLKACSDNKEFCILRIHAGPPYEDIAFKIVNREWEYGYKRGFKCQFHNNIFQLWFHFKRLRYRR